MTTAVMTEEPVEDKEEDESQKEEVDDPNAMEPQQKLFYFAKRGNVEGIKKMAPSTDINAAHSEGFKQSPYISNNTALHYAVTSGSLECVKVLYNLEAKLDAQNKLKSTPLHLAASLGFADIAKFLIDMRANIEAKNLVQNTPLHCAVYAGHVETVKVILAQLDEPRDALLEPNGVGMAAAKYTAHDDMKALLRTYFPKRNNNADDDERKDDGDGEGDEEAAAVAVEEEQPSNPTEEPEEVTNQ